MPLLEGLGIVLKVHAKQYNSLAFVICFLSSCSLVTKLCFVTHCPDAPRQNGKPWQARPLVAPPETQSVSTKLFFQTLEFFCIRLFY
jgi:hypothetical protein